MIVTLIYVQQDPENMNAEPRKFNFDFSYWSHDGYKDQPDGYMVPDKSHANGSKYADQVIYNIEINCLRVNKINSILIQTLDSSSICLLLQSLFSLYTP